jgi:Hemolysins and related proteins containing CBS domains
MSYSSCNPLRLENLSEEGYKNAKRASYIVRHYDDALSTILIGNNLANIAGSSLASIFVITLLGEDKTWIATVAMTILVIIFGETIPKIAANKNANRFALRYSLITRILMIILFPIVWIIVQLIHILSAPFKGSNVSDPDVAVEELQNIIETAEDEDVLNEERSELVRSAIDFSETLAYEVMTARVDVLAIDIDDDWDEILSTIEDSPYSRLPVYENDKDNIIGVLYLNHFLKALTDDARTDIRSLLMPPIYIYKTTKLPDVLNKLRKAKQHLAIVSDEYGGVLGVLSMEDVLEQIVGDIWDETDTIEEEVVQRSENEFEIDGDMTMSDFLELVGIREDTVDAESETVGGWTVELIGDYPRQGDIIEYENLRIKVLEMDGRRVEKLLVIRQDDNQ